MKRNFVFMIIVLVFMCSQAFADKIVLTSGQIIRGKFVGRSQDFVRVETNYGVEVTYDLEEIKSVNNEVFDEGMLAGVPEVVEEEYVPAYEEEEEIVEVPLIVQMEKAVEIQENLEEKFYRAHDKANAELKRSNINGAFKIMGDLFEECDGFQKKRCRDTLSLYLSVTTYALSFIDEVGLYDKIEKYSKGFLNHIEPVENIKDILKEIDRFSEDPNASYGKLFQVYAYHGLFLASKKDIKSAQAFAAKAKKFDENFGRGLQGLIDAYETIFSREDLLILYDVIHGMKFRLSALTEATGFTKGLYDKFRINPSASEKQIVEQLESHLDMVKKEVFSFKSKKEFEGKALPLFIYLLDSETPEFLLWYYKNARKQDPEVREAMDERFKGAFISMINYILLKARGLDVYYVATWGNEPGDGVVEKSEGSFLNPFAEKKKRSPRVERSLCAVKVNDKEMVFVDFLNQWISKKFSFEKIYQKDSGIYYVMKPGVNRKDLYGHFQLMEGSLIPAHVVANLLLQMNIMGYPIESDNRSLKMTIIKNQYSRNAQHLMAYISAREYKSRDAITYLYRSLGLYKNDPRTYYFMGQIYFDDKDFVQANENLNKALELEPGYLDARLLLANSHYEAKDFWSAMDAAKICLKEAPKNPEVHILLLQLHVAFGKNFPAKKHGNIAVRLLKAQGYAERAGAISEYLKSL